jgi:hypothetical protein
MDNLSAAGGYGGAGFKAAVELGHTSTPDQSPLLSALHSHSHGSLGGTMMTDPPPLEPLPGSLESLNGTDNFPSLLSSVSSRKDGLSKDSSSSQVAMTRQEKTAEAFRLRAAAMAADASGGTTAGGIANLGGVSGVKINPAASTTGAVAGSGLDGGGLGLGGDGLTSGGGGGNVSPKAEESQTQGLATNNNAINNGIDGMTIQPGALRMVRRGQGLGGQQQSSLLTSSVTTTTNSDAAAGVPVVVTTAETMESTLQSTIASATLQPTVGGKSEAMKQQASASAFNGLGKCCTC